jgi:hypothetical protein
LILALSILAECLADNVARVFADDFLVAEEIIVLAGKIFRNQEI